MERVPPVAAAAEATAPAAVVAAGAAAAAAQVVPGGASGPCSCVLQQLLAQVFEGRYQLAFEGSEVLLGDGAVLLLLLLLLGAGRGGRVRGLLLGGKLVVVVVVVLVVMRVVVQARTRLEDACVRLEFGLYSGPNQRQAPVCVRPNDARHL